MISLPQELIDIIIRLAHADDLDGWESSSDPARPRDSRTKSNQERLLRGPLYQYTRHASALYKERRLVSRQFLFHHSYSLLLFQTVLLYPHRQSFDKIIALSLSYLRRDVRHVVISLPFLTGTCVEIYRHRYPRVNQFWTSIPPTLSDVLLRFPNLDTLTILPSWDRRLDWMRGRQERFPDLERALTSTWYGCPYGHSSCMGEGEYAEITNLYSLLTYVRPLQRQIRRLNVSNLGTEWIPFLQTQSPDFSGVLPLSPATIVHIGLCGFQCIQELTVSSCALHDLVWFTPVFSELKTLRLENISARHSEEVELFAATFDRHLFPKVDTVVIRLSDLLPGNYLHIFTAIRNHGDIMKVNIDGVHTFCDDGIKVEFELGSNLPRTDLEQLVRQYVRGEDISVDLLSAHWFKMFRRLGCAHHS